MPAQNQRKQSPRPRSKQSQGIATPMRTEYAGPAFHHSPAPSSLPPPPFLMMSRSTSQRKENYTTTSASSSVPQDSSPLGFLFDAKQREESLQGLKTEKPPTLGFNFTPHDQTHESSSQPRSTPVTVHTADRNLAKAVQKSANEASSTPSRDESKEPTSKKKSPWMAIERARPIDITTPEATVESNATLVAQSQHVRPSTAQSTGDRGHRSETKRIKPTDQELRSGKKSNTDAARKKRGPKKSLTSQTSSPTAAVVPKTILKREQPAVEVKVAEVRSDVAKEEKKPQRVRKANTSTFRPLQPQATMHEQTPFQPATRTNESEDDLRRQAAHLMSILNISTPSPREMSPARHYSKPTSPAESTSMESDLRRMLRMGA